MGDIQEDPSLCLHKEGAVRTDFDLGIDLLLMMKKQQNVSIKLNNISISQ